MLNRLKRLSAISLLAVAPLGLPAAAEDAPTAETVVATVDGTEITLGHMISLRTSLPQQYAQLPAKVLFNGILDQLVQQTVLAQSTDGEISKRAQIRIENERRAIIAGDALEDVVAEATDEEAVAAAFEEKYADAEPEREYKAAHILVESEDEAKAIAEDLAGGADFAELAREKSTGPSGSNGGDLGWFSQGMMVESFEEAAMALEPGEVSDPVKTQFGWHVIRLDDTRMKDLPELEEVRGEIEQELREAAVDAHVQKLTDAADVDRPEANAFDPSLLNRTELLEQ
ncbi:peptidylprolyl isomerase [Roseovarius salinarum]|uniref:peptidylprolyl isomerase n=1 Tax=Roseovarius salinarum TaxID=1981892 RepID=UPI000C3358EB|nr:peptidylprolyl isomerase [Roseovarius salinarum]